MNEEQRQKKQAANRRWYLEHREEAIAKSTIAQRAKQGDPEYNKARVRYVQAFIQRNPAKAILQVMKRNARVRGQVCTISLEEVERLLAPMLCEVTGLPLRWNKSIVRDDLAPSPDQIEHGRGYIPGNVRIVCWMYNRVRGEWTDEQMIENLRLLLERLI